MHRRLLAFIAPIAALAASAFAHFPFVVPDAGGATARLLMSETLVPDPEVGIEFLAGTTLSLRTADGRDIPLTLTKGEKWMTMALPGDGTRVVHGLSDLGYMQRGTGRPHLLIYHPKTIVGDAFDKSTVLGDRVPVELVPVRAGHGSGFKLKLVIAGKATPGQEIRLINPEGDDEDYTTDENGLIGPFIEPGRYGAWARHWVDETGKRGDKSYDQVRHYATLVFDFGDAEAPHAEAEIVDSLSVRTFAELPYHVASFGAVVSDGYLYLYGGHIAERHEYNTESVSKKFQRLNLSNPAKWEELPAGNVAIQGMNLAAHDGRIIRVGGMEPRNPPGTKGDSYSIVDSTYFDTKANKWVALPPLPRPRSSHDVVVVGDTVYVIGGWEMKGRGEEPEFFETMEVLDLSASAPEWRTVPQPFSRRALIAATLDDKIYVFGGFDADDVPHLAVDVYDTKSQSWSKGPAIPGRERDGFAPAACTVDGTIYLSVGSGKFYRLNDAKTAWETVAKTTPRLAHRMVPFGNEVLIVGGAAEAKMVNLIEAVEVGSARGSASVPTAK